MIYRMLYIVCYCFIIVIFMDLHVLYRLRAIYHLFSF